MIYDAKSMAGGTVFRLWQEGVNLECPVCGAVLSAIPEGLPRTALPLGLFCPRNKQHVYMYGESKEALDSVRRVIKEMVQKNDAKKG